MKTTISKEVLDKIELKSRKKQPVIKISLPQGYGMIFDEFDDTTTLLEQDLSMDFVDELRNREREIPDGPLTIYLRLAQEMRDKPNEVLIGSRLKDYFVSQHEDHTAKFNWKRKLGIYLIVAGIISEAFVANASHFIFAEGFLSQIPNRIFTLFGYGGFFFGVERVLEAYGGQDDLRFFRRMSEAKIVFRDTEPKSQKREAREPDFMI